MSGMLDVTHQSDRPQDYKDQVFIGKVVVNDDIKKFHRIKVEIPDMWDCFKQCELPWCTPGFIMGGCGPTEYSQNIPETGSFVYVTFQNGDNHFPIYWGGVRDYQTMKGILDENYPHRIGWQVNSYKEVHSGDERKRKHESKESPEPYNRVGHHFFLDRKTNEVEYEHATKTRVNIKPNGRMFVEVRARDLPDGGDFIMHTDRHYILEVSNALFPGPPGHYYCNVLEDWWETHVETHVLLESRTDRMDLKAPKVIRIESTGDSIEIIAAQDVVVRAGRNVTVTAGGSITANAGTSITATAGTEISLNAPVINLNAPTVNVNGFLHVSQSARIDDNLSVGGSVDVGGGIVAGGSIVDGDGDGGA